MGMRPFIVGARPLYRQDLREPLRPAPGATTGRRHRISSGRSPRGSVPTPAATTGPGPPIPPAWWTASSPPARDATSSTSGAAPASPPGCSRRPAAGCSAWIPTRGWPSRPGRAGPRRKSRSSRTGTRRAARSTRSSPHRPGTGWTRSQARRRPPRCCAPAAAGFWASPAVDAYRAGCARVADAIRQAGAFGEPEEWLSYWERPYTRDEWLDLVPTTGGFTRHPEAIQQELLDGLGAAVDAAGGTFTMSYTTIAATAARLAS